MKKLIFICLLALSYISTKAQEPTIEQTVTFLKSNILYFNQDYYKFVEITERGFYDPWEVSVYGLKEDLWLDFSKIKSVTIEEPKDPEGDKRVTKIKVTGDFNYYSYVGFIESPTERKERQKFIKIQSYTYLHLSKTINAERIKKALLHAAKLNGASLISDDLFKN